MGKRWTEAERAKLKRLVNERKPVKEIAHILGRTINAVNGAKDKLGVYKPTRLSPKKPITRC